MATSTSERGQKRKKNKEKRKKVKEMIARTVLSVAN